MSSQHWTLADPMCCNNDAKFPSFFPQPPWLSCHLQKRQKNPVGWAGLRESSLKKERLHISRSGGYTGHSSPSIVTVPEIPEASDFHAAEGDVQIGGLNPVSLALPGPVKQHVLSGNPGFPCSMLSFTS